MDALIFPDLLHLHLKDPLSDDDPVDVLSRHRPYRLDSIVDSPLPRDLEVAVVEEPGQKVLVKDSEWVLVVLNRLFVVLVDGLAERLHDEVVDEGIKDLPRLLKIFHRQFDRYYFVSKFF